MFARRVTREGEPAARRWYREEVMAFVVHTPGLGASGVKRDYGGGAMEGLRQVGTIVKGLRRAPGFTALAVFTLALGIGANALIFAIADRAVFRPLPFPEPDRLVSVLDGWTTAPGSLEILQDELRGVETIGGAIDALGMTYEPIDGPAQRVSVAQVTPEYFTALGAAPRVGRLFQVEESEPGLGDVVVLSSDFFTSNFGADPSIIGSSLTLEGTNRRIVGVLPEDFAFPSSRNDLWIPLTMDSSPANVGYHWGMGIVALVARLEAGATPETVRQDVLRAQAAVRVANPLWTPAPDFWDEARVSALQESRSRWARTPVLLLLGALAVVLLVVCANVANLLLSRGLARQRDLAVQTALGAGRTRLAANQLVEVVILTAAGTAVGLVFASFGLEVLRPLLPAEVPGLDQVGLDMRVIGSTTVVALLVAVAAAMVPAMRVGRSSPGDFLRESGRGHSTSRSRRRTTSVLVAAQMAAAVVLVTGAGLLARSLYELNRVDPGFVSNGRVTARLDLPPGLDHDREARARYFSEIQEALLADPALDGVALASSFPFGPEWENMAVAIPGVTQDPNNLPVVYQRRVTGSFFEVAGIAVLAGRTFDDSDRVDTPPVAVVDEAFARAFFDGVDPVGRTVRYPWRGAGDIQIVGVVASTRDEELSSDPSPTVWMPLSQLAGGMVDHALVVASAPVAEAGLAAIQSRARAFDDRMAVSELATYPELLRDSLALPRLLTMLLLLFAGSTLLLGCVGVYGVASFSARERVREIGVRMTLGAHPSEIRGRFLREGLWLAVPGGVIGLIVATLSGRVLSGFLYQVSPIDPVTFVAAPVILVAAALAAVYVPASRATRVDPATVLREG